MNSPFIIRPKRWYDWINPYWWRRAKLTKRIADYMWEKEGMEEKISEAIRDCYTYGTGIIELGKYKIRISPEEK